LFQALVEENDDLDHLVKQGHAVAFDGNYLVVRDIPYLDETLSGMTGAIVSKVVFKDQERVTLEDHQIFFAGGIPHGLDGKPIPNLGGGPTTLALSEASADVVIQRSFSNKPRTGTFANFFDKIESYVAIVSGPAMTLHGMTPYTFRSVGGSEQSSVFKFRDTLTSLAEISDLAAKFHDDVVAIIGLGGTGSYVLDFLVKTPVREIRAFDADAFFVHNAFRSPGRLEESELNTPKASVYLSRYTNFRHGLRIEQKFIDRTSGEDLQGVTFAFVCVDKGSSRAQIFDLLVEKGIPYIDVGMGLDRKRGPINGMLRTTLFPAERAREVRERQFAPESDRPDDIYRTNIQISELNALNASLAVIRFKQLRGFYVEQDAYMNMLFDVADGKTVAEQL
jgi:hypothetical protein